LFKFSHNLLFSIRMMDNSDDIFWQRKPLF